MSLPAGLAVAVLILLLVPAVAVVAGRRWHDPPRERWGIPPERRAAAANRPQLVAYRRRIELGVTDPRTAAVVDQAIRTGTAAPPELRAATRELAELRVVELEHRSHTVRVVFVLWLVIAVLTFGLGVYLAARHGSWFLLVYSLWPFIRAYLHSPLLLRRRQGRAKAAVLANASG